MNKLEQEVLDKCDVETLMAVAYHVLEPKHYEEFLKYCLNYQKNGDKKESVLDRLGLSSKQEYALYYYYVEELNEDENDIEDIYDMDDYWVMEIKGGDTYRLYQDEWDAEDANLEDIEKYKGFYIGKVDD